MSADPVVVPMGPEEDKHDASEPDKDEDVGITFVARRTPETPKERPKSGKIYHTILTPKNEFNLP